MNLYDRKRFANAMGEHEHTLRFWVSDLNAQRREQRKAKRRTSRD